MEVWHSHRTVPKSWDSDTLRRQAGWDLCASCSFPAAAGLPYRRTARERVGETVKFDTRFTRLLGIEYPIVQGGMRWAARAELAAAVGNPGGIGFLFPQTPPTP